MAIKIQEPTLFLRVDKKKKDGRMPFSHRIYAEKEKQARKRFHVPERPWYTVKYWEDPNYPFDWTEGEFC